jgi:hypothetical protein
LFVESINGWMFAEQESCIGGQIWSLRCFSEMIGFLLSMNVNEVKIKHSDFVISTKLFYRFSGRIRTFYRRKTDSYRFVTRCSVVPIAFSNILTKSFGWLRTKSSAFFCLFCLFYSLKTAKLLEIENFFNFN